MVRIGMIALGVSLGLLLMPAHTRACSYDGGVLELVPTGASHPANAAVVLVGWMLRADDLSATIDGVPVEITVDDDLAVEHGSGLFHVLPLRLDPAPEPGQDVVITGNPCGPLNCPGLGIEYVASEPDLEILGAAPSLSFDVARVLEAETMCGISGSRLRVSASVDALAFAGEALVMYEVTARNEDAGLTATQRQVFSGAELEAWVMFGETGDEFPMDGWCVELGTIDAAGNRGPVASSCDACGRSYGEPTEDGDIEFEPVPGGPCDIAGSTSDGESSTGEPPGPETGASTAADESGGASAESGAASSSDGSTGDAPGADGVSDRGCACAAGGGVGGPVLLGLALGLRRRRR